MERTVVNVFRAQCNPVWHFLSLIVFVKKVFTDTFRTPTPEAWSNSCPLSQRYHPTISSSFVPSSSCLQSFPASPSFPMSQFFTSGGQTIGVSALASVLPMNIQDWLPLILAYLILLLSKGLSRVLSNTTVQKHKFISTQLSLQSNSHIHTWLPEKTYFD